jgi:hypothetical protein
MKDNIVEMKESENSIYRRPDLWYYKVDDVIKKDNLEKVLTLNLVEVTVPFGYATVNFTRTEEGDINDSKMPITNYNSLVEAKRRKEKKYKLIKEEAEKFLGGYDEELKKTFDVSKIRVETHFVIVSSLGIVPQETTKMMKRMFKIQGRTESQTINILPKRMSLAAIKRSHQLYTRIYNKNCCIDNIYKAEIRSYDTANEMLDK